MPTAQELDLQWIRGTTPKLVARFTTNGSPIEFDDARLTVFTGNPDKTLAFRLTCVPPAGGVISDPDAGEVTFSMTAAQTRSLTKSKDGEIGKNRYEVEIRNGTDEQVYLYGVIAAIGGLNDDEA